MALTNPNMVREKNENYNKIVTSLVKRVSDMQFESIINELKYEEFNTLYRVYVNMKYTESQNLRKLFKSHFRSEALSRAFENKDFAEFQFAEATAAEYDPIKPRVVGGLSESLAKANLQDL